ncbi:hypothetical protein AQAU111925_10745 [Aquirufa aurantiipilula]
MKEGCLNPSNNRSFFMQSIFSRFIHFITNKSDYKIKIKGVNNSLNRSTKSGTFVTKM